MCDYCISPCYALPPTIVFVPCLCVYILCVHFAGAVRLGIGLCFVKLGNLEKARLVYVDNVHR